MVFLVTVTLAQLLWIALPVRLRVNESGDYTGFYAFAGHILARGGSLVDGSGALLSRYPPGYPALLGLVFRFSELTGMDESNAVRWAHLLCAGLGSVCFLRLARRLWRPRTAFAVALAWATYPASLWLTRQPSSEIPFLVAQFTAFEAALLALRHRRRRGGWAFLAGALAGIASLIRPIGLAVGVLLAVLAWRGTRALSLRSKTLLSTALLLGNVLAILPWEAYAWCRLGRVIPLSTGGPASLLDGWTYAVNPDKTFATSHPPPAEVLRFMQGLQARRAEFQSSAGSLRAILGESLSAPRAAVRFLAIKTARSWYGTDSGRFESATLAMQSAYGVLLLAGAIAAWRRGGARRRVACGTAVMAGYFWVLTILTLSIARYMVPAIALLFLLGPHLVPGNRRR